jgi:hypothetical protein
MPTAGYSSTPLHKKLGLKEGLSVKLINAPDNYPSLISEMADKLVFKNKATSNLNFIHFFTNSAKELEAKLPLLKEQITKDGIIWVSWYKKSSGKATEVTEDMVRNTALAIGLVDVKICAVDENWSGLKLVYRLKDR